MTNEEFMDFAKLTRYYEATYNGDKDELYIDMYYKQANRCYKNVSNQSQELNQ